MRKKSLRGPRILLGLAYANAGGTSGSVWIGVAGNRDYVSEVDAAILNRGIHGPDLVVHPNRNFFSGTLVCAEAPERTPNGYNPLGRPGETVEG